MDLSLIFKIAGIGLIITVINQVLSKNGRDDQANLVSLAGVIIVLFMLVSKLGELIALIQNIFGV